MHATVQQVHVLPAAGRVTTVTVPADASQRGPLAAPSPWPPCPPSGSAGGSAESEQGGAEREVAEVLQGLIEGAMAGASRTGASVQGPGTERDGQGEAAHDSRGVEQAELSVDFSGAAHMADDGANAPFEGSLQDRDRAQAQAGVRELLLGILRADFGRRLRWTQGRERAGVGGVAGGAGAAPELLRDGLTRARACATRRAVFSRNFVTPTRLSQGRAGRARPVSACAIAGNRNLQAAVRDAVLDARASHFRREEVRMRRGEASRSAAECMYDTMLAGDAGRQRQEGLATTPASTPVGDVTHPRDALAGFDSPAAASGRRGTEAQAAEDRREEVARERRAEAAACDGTRRPLSARSNSSSPGWLSSVVGGLLFVPPPCVCVCVCVYVCVYESCRMRVYVCVYE